MLTVIQYVFQQILRTIPVTVNELIGVQDTAVSQVVINKKGKFWHRRITGTMGRGAGGRVVGVRGGDGLSLPGSPQGEGIAEGGVAATLGELHEEGLRQAVYGCWRFAFDAVLDEAHFALQDEPPGAIAEAHGDERIRDGDVSPVDLVGSQGKLVALIKRPRSAR